MFQIDFYFFNLKTHDIEIFQSQDYLAISGVVDGELVVGPPGALDAVAATPGLLPHLDSGAGIELLQYSHDPSYQSYGENFDFSLTTSKHTPEVLQSLVSALP